MSDRTEVGQNVYQLLQDFKMTRNQLSDNNEKKIAGEWARKITQTTIKSEQESKIQQDFLFYLNKSCETGKLLPPFHRPPPNMNIVDMIDLLNDEKLDGTSTVGQSAATQQHEIFERSPDKGAFLISQPVPRCGAYCYLAVVSRRPNK